MDDSYNFNGLLSEMQLVVIENMSNTEKYCLKLTSTHWLDVLHNIRMDYGTRIEIVLRKYPQHIFDITKCSDHYLDPIFRQYPEIFSNDDITIFYRYYIKHILESFQKNFAIDSDMRNIAKITMGVSNYHEFSEDSYDDWYTYDYFKFNYDCGKDTSNIKCAFCGSKYGDSVEPHHLIMMTHRNELYDYHINEDYKFRLYTTGWDIFNGNTFMIGNKPIHILQFIIAKIRYMASIKN